MQLLFMICLCINSFLLLLIFAILKFRYISTVDSDCFLSKYTYGLSDYSIYLWIFLFMISIIVSLSIVMMIVVNSRKMVLLHFVA